MQSAPQIHLSGSAVSSPAGSGQNPSRKLVLWVFRDQKTRVIAKNIVLYSAEQYQRIEADVFFERHVVMFTMLFLWCFDAQNTS